MSNEDEERAINILHSRCLRVLQVGVHHGIDTLILGPWGCGINKNPPKQVAKAFAAALLHPDVEGKFENVFFAIPQEEKTSVYKEFSKLFLDYKR